MDIKYILSQILVAIAFIILGIGFRREKRIQILTYSSIFQIFSIASYALLNGVMGIISCIISLFRNILFILITRIGNIIVGFCSIIYAIPLKSWLLVVCELYVIINTIVGLVKYNIKIVDK